MFLFHETKSTHKRQERLTVKAGHAIVRALIRHSSALRMVRRLSRKMMFKRLIAFLEASEAPEPERKEQVRLE